MANTLLPIQLLTPALASSILAAAAFRFLRETYRILDTWNIRRTYPNFKFVMYQAIVCVSLKTAMI